MSVPQSAVRPFWGNQRREPAVIQCFQEGNGCLRFQGTGSNHNFFKLGNLLYAYLRSSADEANRNILFAKPEGTTLDRPQQHLKVLSINILNRMQDKGHAKSHKEQASNDGTSSSQKPLRAMVLGIWYSLDLQTDVDFMNRRPGCLKTAQKGSRVGSPLHGQDENIIVFF